MMKRSPLATAVVVLAMTMSALLTGCGAIRQQLNPDTSALGSLATALKKLQASKVALAGVYVTTASVVVDFQKADGTLVTQTVWPGTYDERVSPVSKATASWDVFDPDEISRQAAQLAHECPDQFIVDFTAVTTKAVVSTVRCTGDLLPPLGTPSADAKLNGQPFPVVSGAWSASDWDKLLAEWTSIAGSTNALTITTTGKRPSPTPYQSDVITVTFDHETRGGCFPSLTQSFDGKSLVRVTCSSTESFANFGFPLTWLSGEMISQAATKIFNDQKTAPSSNASYFIRKYPPKLELFITQGEMKGYAPLG